MPSPVPAKASPVPAKASPVPAPVSPPAALPPSPPARPAERTQELRDDDLVAVRPRAVWEHATLPATGAPLPSLAGHGFAKTAPVAAPADVGGLQGGVPGTSHPNRGVWIIVAAVLVAVAILGAAFWYRARQEQLRREQEIEERLRMIIQRG
jgi:hypothetical protein